MAEEPTTVGGSTETRTRSIALFRFLHDLTELRVRAVRSIDDWARDGKVVWLAALPEAPECRVLAWRETAVDGADEEAQEVWFEVDRPRRTPPPQPPAALEPWLDAGTLADSQRLEPTVHDQITVPDQDGGAPRTRSLAAEPQVRELWQWYLHKRWRPWAADDARLARVEQVYGDLFTVQQKQQRRGEEYEVVMGFGFLTWRGRNGVAIERHVLTAQASVELDGRSGRITVGPGGDGARPVLEQEMLEPSDRPDPDTLARLERRIDDIGDAISDRAQVESVLTAWVHMLAAKGHYDHGVEPPSDKSDAPRVSFAPALILRRRNERSLIRVFKAILDQHKRGAPIPPGVARYVSIVDDRGQREPASEAAADRHSVEPEYLPLEANAEQRAIVARIRDQQGVLVQGPPGTGKSHTIANLICHLLATGQRVLVTSHTARALMVLRDKLPPRIAELCVDLPGATREALQSLERSVQAITDAHEAWDEAEGRARITALAAELDASRGREAELDTALQALRERDSFVHEPGFGGYRGTLLAIARRLAEEAPSLGFVPDRIAETTPPPLGAEAARTLGQRIAEVAAFAPEDVERPPPPPDAVLTPDELAARLAELDAIEAELEAAAAARAHASYGALLGGAEAPRRELVRRLGAITTGLASLARHARPWARTAGLQVVADQDRAWRERFARTREHLDAIGDGARDADGVRVHGIDDREPRAVAHDARNLLEHLEGGGGLGFWFVRPPAVKRALYLVRSVTVDGQPCSDADALRRLLRRLDVDERLDALRALWADVDAAPSGPRAVATAHYEDLCEPLGLAVSLHDELRAARDALLAIPGAPEPSWHDEASLRGLHAAARAAERAARRTSLAAEFERRVDALRAGARHRVVAGLADALAARDRDRYATAFALLEELRRKHARIRERDELLARLAAAAPELARELARPEAGATAADRLSRFEAAWSHARARAFVTAHLDPTHEARVRDELRLARAESRDALTGLATERAWQHCLDRLTERERQHLVAWSKAVRRIGKGTGKHAGRHRRAAREHMTQCRSAIPAWIMPIYRVAETMQPGSDAFDVVIIDEASQSGPEALFLLYLTQKIVVVGDDKQISPDWVGITRDDVEHLRQRYLQDVPHSDAFSLEHSLFDLAEIRYGGRIRLREHFRCMPEIIQFCNNLCYATEPLIPLKQFGAGRLAPVIVTRHVPDGYREGSGTRIVNPPEARAVVDAIARCCADPAYAGKTMGVVSLQGPHQALAIEAALLERLGPDAVLERELVCGDAYAFQGDERDVMFLSMVAAPSPDARIGTLADQRSERRFNVAVSRAKEQLWLFHTPTLNDLSPKCLRHALLEYCLLPRVEAGGGIDAEALAAAARDRARRPPAPFDSWFEVDVCLAIVTRGHRVIPQLEVAGYRIDLVVDGMVRRLAVECDGDEWHGAERFALDLARQRQLERCGWRFWRVRGSRFYLDRESALAELWRLLDELGVDSTAPSSAVPQPEHEPAPAATSEGEDPAAPSPARARPADGPIGYEAWSGGPLPDPRGAEPDTLVDGIVAIVTVEGPILVERAIRIQAEAAGIARLTRAIRDALEQAILAAVDAGRLTATTIAGDAEPEVVLSLPDTPPVVLRECGPRSFEEVPPNEVKAMLYHLAVLEPGLADEDLFRRALEGYGLSRLTAKARERLERCRSLPG
jgi:very-short-patch-repair endonuclease